MYCPQCCCCIVVVVSLIAQWLDVVLWSRFKQLASDLYEISEFSITCIKPPASRPQQGTRSERESAVPSLRDSLYYSLCRSFSPHPLPVPCTSPLVCQTPKQTSHKHLSASGQKI